MAVKDHGKLTPKQAAFVREYLIDQNATQAAIRAGYSKATANQQGSRLLANVGVAAALRAKQAMFARKADITVESLTSELEQARRLALKEKQSAAAVSATLGKAKLHGLLVERHKHSGAVGSYDLTKISDADLDRLESILGTVAATGGDSGGEGSPSS
jgi:hypothetical protein